NVYYALKSQKKDVKKFKRFLFKKLEFISKEFNYKFNIMNNYLVFEGLNKHFIWLNRNQSYVFINFSEEDYLTQIHEIVEGEILSKSNFYKNDKYTRWIGDGIAEYARYKCFKKLHPNKDFFIIKKFFGLIKMKKIAIWEIRDNKKYFDLRKFKVYETMDEVEGITYFEMYVISMYFWYKITNKCGDQIIGKFLNEASKLDKLTNKELVPLLSEITGMDIDKELNVNLEEVVEFVNNN
ncbi:hypothetical protein KAU33_01775, partial [Candidatus Dependentiae bacterium]|nr:hypothetical protein [Candidatus Dependentiae bacterium]